MRISPVEDNCAARLAKTKNGLRCKEAIVRVRSSSSMGRYF